jgi:hypothetical protein
MATAKYGIKSPEWAKHLRPYNKKKFWAQLRTFYAKKIKSEVGDEQAQVYVQTQ